MINDYYRCVESNNLFASLMKNRSFCAGEIGISSVCLGDSGNGLYVVNQGIYFIRGIVSSSPSIENCNIHQYAIYTNAPSFDEWIHENMEQTYLNPLER